MAETRGAATDWRKIEREAHEQVIADAQAIEAKPLGYGASVAWAVCRFGRTDDLSVVHRAGESTNGEAFALCGEPIPAAMMRVALTWELIGALGRCKHCEVEYMERENAA